MLTAHISAVALTLFLVLIADKQAIAWMRGKKEFLAPQTLKRMHIFVWLGLAVVISTGAYMAYPLREYLFHHPPFIGKMTFVGLLLVNGVVIGKLMRIATKKRFAELTNGERTALFMSGAVSAISWLGALTLAFFLF